MKTKTELKRIARQAFYSQYGCYPKLSEIILLESNGDGTYIMFRLNTHEYQFRTRVMHADGSVWVGSGTLEQCK